MQETFKLAFFSWLEIPYFIGIDYETETDCTIHYNEYIGEIQLHIKLRRDLFRIFTYNKWTCSDYRAEQDKRLLENPNQEISYFPYYVTEEDLSYIKELVQRHNLPYLHVEKTKAVFELYAEFDIPNSVYQDIAPRLGYYWIDRFLFPSINLFNREIFPKIASIIDTYRVATLPSLRYKIYPISENLIEDAFIEIKDIATGKILRQCKHGLDFRNHGQSMKHHEVDLDVQKRFNSLIDCPERIEFELRFCSAYYLFHMRRWAEAITIASGVVDSLTQMLIFKKPYKDAEELWKNNRNKYKYLFKKELPKLGYKNLADINKELWDSFIEAKEYRGGVAHGAKINLFQSKQEEIVLKHLNTLYDVANFLSKQGGKDWMLNGNS